MTPSPSPSPPLHPCVDSKRLRVHIQNVPVCTGTTRTCVSKCARGGTHGDVFERPTETGRDREDGRGENKRREERRAKMKEKTKEKMKDKTSEKKMKRDKEINNEKGQRSREREREMKMKRDRDDER